MWKVLTMFRINPAGLPRNRKVVALEVRSDVGIGRDDTTF
jgi:hypothetical protein